MSSRHPSIALSAALVAAVLPASARAQPVCAAGTVADYVALAGGCRIDGVTFSGFQASFARFGVSPAVSRPLGDVAITPVGSGDLVGFGLAITPPLAVSTITGTISGGSTFELTFDVSGVGAGGTVGLAPIALFTALIDATAGGATPLRASARIAVSSEPNGAEALAETVQLGAARATYRCASGATNVPCGPLVSAPFAGGRVHARAEVVAQGIRSVPVSASLTSLNVLIGVPAAAPPPPAVVPEPGASALLASGLLGLGAARRRRGRSA